MARRGKAGRGRPRRISYGSVNGWVMAGDGSVEDRERWRSAGIGRHWPRGGWFSGRNGSGRRGFGRSGVAYLASRMSIWKSSARSLVLLALMVSWVRGVSVLGNQVDWKIGVWLRS